MKYKFTMIGPSIVDGKTYSAECWCITLSLGEKKDWAKEYKLDFDKCVFKKENVESKL